MGRRWYAAINPNNTGDKIITINYAPLLTQQEYVDALVGFITGMEGVRAHVYADKDKMATIGYGYTFNRNDNVALWQAAGITLTTAELTLLQQA